MIKANFHTHSIYCDGNNSLEELVQQGIKLGFDRLGFSGHSFTRFDQSYCMSEENTLKYQQEVRLLQEKYQGQIKLYLGIEQDFYSTADISPYDYVIGSVHYVKKNENYLSIDENVESLCRYRDKYYAGDIYGLIEDYYETVGNLAQRECQIIGHFDLICKFQEQMPLFDENHPRYQKAAKAALEKLLDAGKIIEINTGAMARGVRTTPYPDKRWLELIAEKNGTMLPNSDCHDKNYLDFGFDEKTLAAYLPYITESLF